MCMNGAVDYKIFIFGYIANVNNKALGISGRLSHSKRVRGEGGVAGSRLCENAKLYNKFLRRYSYSKVALFKHRSESDWAPYRVVHVTLLIMIHRLGDSKANTVGRIRIP